MRRLLPLVLMTLCACTEMVLPDMQLPVEDGVELGIDPLAANPVLGVTVTDPLRRVH